MIIKLFRTSLFLILTILTFIQAQVEFEILALEGSAKVQRAQKKSWDDIAIGTKIKDNDIVETFFQTKMIARFGNGNIAILGSNSKALFNIIEKDNTGVKIIDASITLFAGGCFAKAIVQANISIYTSNAVGETSNGTLSAIVDPKSGETGFQVLSGQASTRNIAQKEGRALTPGQTTIIRPGKQPTAPLYITYRHVAVLKHFFGDSYVDQELERAGISPTDERAGQGRSGNQDIFVGGRGSSKDQFMYKSLFSLNRIYGIILDDNAQRAITYAPIQKPARTHSNALMVGLANHFTFANNGAYPMFVLTPSYKTAFVDLGLRFTFASNFDGFTAGVTSVAGYLDKVDHITVGSDTSAFCIRLGTLADYTAGDGLVVNRFTAKNGYAVFNPLSLSGHYSMEDFLNVQAFIADISTWDIGGLHTAVSAGLYTFGLGIYYDVNQFHATTPSENDRFVQLPDAIPPADSATSGIFAYELDFKYELISQDDFKAWLAFEFAQNLSNMSSQGIAMRIPKFSFAYRKVTFGANLLIESEHVIAGQFHSFYPSNRYRIWGRAANPDSMTTQNLLLSKNKHTKAIEAMFSTSPLNGISIETALRINLKSTAAYSKNEKIPAGGTEYHLRLAVNHELISFLQYAALNLDQIHGGLFPVVGNAFASWGFNAGIEAQTLPLLFNVAINGGFHFSYLDLVDGQGRQRFNDNIDAGDMLFDVFIGFSWGMF